MDSLASAYFPQEVAEAARAGATGIEHVASIESLPDELVALLVKNGTFIDPTFAELNAAMVCAGSTRTNARKCCGKDISL